MNMMRRSKSGQIISDENGDALYRPEIARGFRNIRNSDIVLQDARVSNKYFKCLLQVRNRTFEKAVWARIIFDIWEEYRDVKANWRRSDSEEVEIYEFVVDWPETSQKVKFTVCSRQCDIEKWDMGPFGNYVFIRPPKWTLHTNLLPCVKRSFSEKPYLNQEFDLRLGKSHSFEKGTQTNTQMTKVNDEDELSLILYRESEDPRTFTIDSAYTTCFEMAQTLGAKEFFEIAKDVCIKLETEEASFDQYQERSVKKNFDVCNVIKVDRKYLPLLWNRNRILADAADCWVILSNTSCLRSENRQG